MVRVLGLFIALSVFGLGLLGIEALARYMKLDQRQGQAMALSTDGSFESPGQVPLETTGIDYLPSGFSMDSQGFDSIWGRCDYGFKGPSVLAMGDSTTRYCSRKSTGADSPDLSWPSVLAARLGPARQVCVVAEAGYHPADILALYDVLGPPLRPAVLVLLLCANDLVDISHRKAMNIGGRAVFYQEPRQRLAFRPMYWPWLFHGSEAFRFFHWRFALLMPAWAFAVPVPEERRLLGTMSARSSLLELKEKVEHLVVFFIPPLTEEHEDADRRLQEMRESTGIDIHSVVLPSPVSRFRRNTEDTVHMNQDGHAIVAGAVFSYLESDPGLPLPAVDTLNTGYPVTTDEGPIPNGDPKCNLPSPSPSCDP